MQERARAEPFTALKLVVGFLVAVYGIYYAYFTPYTSELYTAIHLGSMLVLYAMVRVDVSSSDRQKIVNAAFGILALASTVYFYYMFDVIRESRVITGYTGFDYLFAVVIIVLVTEYTRREFGNVLFGVIVAVVLYALFGTMFPGMFEHRGMDVSQIIDVSVLNFEGLYGQLTRIAALWIFIFLIWAGLFREFDDIDRLLNATLAIATRSKYSVFQVPVVGSMFVGSIMGSGAGNIAVTGNFSIPLLDGYGMPKKRAAAIEAVSSAGGMVLPPIMGAAAFLMAILVNEPYSQIILYGAIPGLLLYLLLVSSVHIAAIRTETIQTELTTSPLDELEETHRTSQLSLLPLVVSTLVLVYTLVALGFGPTLAGIYTVGSYLGGKLLTFLFVEKRSIWEFGSRVFTGSARGAIIMAPITIVLAAMGMIVIVFNSTGLPVTISLVATSIAGESLLSMLVLAMVVTIIFGMGMPLTVAYLLAASLLVPSLTEYGVPLIAAHFFILYWGMVSTISPPIALGCAVASNIAEVEFLETVYEALRIGLPYYILPFGMIYYDAILYHNGLETIVHALIVFGSLSMFIVGVQYPFKARAYNLVFFVAGALAFVLPIYALAGVF